MGHTHGRITEIRLHPGGQVEAFITCPPVAIPLPGQYLLAADPGDPEAALASPLFLAQKSAHGFWVAPTIPALWKPGTELRLVGPLGHGFDLPHNVQRLALVTLGETAQRLLPLAQVDSQTHRGITLFTDLPLPNLPASLEAYPLSSLPEALDWPDYMALDLPLERLTELRAVLGISGVTRPGFPIQALLTTPMPCSGMARCGACAVPSHRGYKLACEDGPVFDLKALKW